ncbi:sigma-54 interaction domain-containing protein [Zhaonella formicivorans]|uniref:sigma-54 interaction domain-containing protein n=1 Tax=Zhaonella formicivorans TaxID=2528593 RepID=UPI0010E1ECD3|nr:sigma 54-interacting transcriptional regulator [Zhaonella formicivorans]
MGCTEQDKLQGLAAYFTFDTFFPPKNVALNKFSSSSDGLHRICEELIESYKKKNTEQLLNALLSREILIEILKSIQEGVQVVDNQGIIRYVNNAFLKMLGLKEHERIGKSVFEVSPDGSLATVLKTGQPVNNLRNRPKGTSVELISSAAPIQICGQMIGAIAITQDIQDIINLTEQLRKSKVMVESLSEKIGYLSKATYTFEDLIGSSVAMQNVIDMAKIAAQSDITVLIQGETGTGKEVIAHAIHNSSARAKRPFISVNCSAIPQNLLESEFFGHEKGSFTGAYKRKLGKFELANGGTLFLDEIGEMDLVLQAKILRAIQEKEIQRVGGETKIPLDVRIIAATNRNLRTMVAEGSFRQDLFYRLNVWNIMIPPLRERKADLEILAEFLLRKLSRKLGRKDNIALSKKALDIMYKYDWPGNVRELENVLERAVLHSKGKSIIEDNDLKFLSIEGISVIDQSLNIIMPLEEAEKLIIKNAIAQYGSSYESKKKIANALGISLATLYNKLQKYKLSKEVSW